MENNFTISSLMELRNQSSSSKRETFRGIRLLLKGSLQSHCNTLVGHSRIPNKYDHFHDRTYVSTSSRKKRSVSFYSTPANFLTVEEFYNIQMPIMREYRKIGFPRTPLPKY